MHTALVRPTALAVSCSAFLSPDLHICIYFANRVYHYKALLSRHNAKIYSTIKSDRMCSRLNDYNIPKINNRFNSNEEAATTEIAIFQIFLLILVSISPICSLSCVISSNKSLCFFSITLFKSNI